MDEPIEKIPLDENSEDDSDKTDKTDEIRIF